MPEMEIKRTNFFDGQFLKQGEFLDLDAYHRHMRRRFLYLLFDKSGVIQSAAGDLALSVENTLLKTVRVKAGVAIGKNTDQVEAKEIVLRTDQIVDVSGTALGAADTAILSIHYGELPGDPSSQGGVTGDTRIREQALIEVHKNTVPAVAANGEPYIRLGAVDQNMNLVNPPPRDVSFIQTALIAATPAISLSPNVITVGTTGDVIITAAGGLDLTGLLAADVVVSGGLTRNAVTPISSTSARVNVTANTAGPQTITVKGVVGNITVGAGLSISGFGKVDQPGGDTTFEINGTGFAGATQVSFTKAGGGLTAPVPLAAGNVTATVLSVPLASIPDDAIVGPVQVQSGALTTTSVGNATPPPKVTNLPALPVTTVQRGTPLTLNGFRFVAPIHIRLMRGAPAVEIMHKQSPPGGTFPVAGESIAADGKTLVVMIPSTLAAGACEVRVENDGGNIVAGPLTVTL